MELYQASLHAPLLSGVQRPRALANHLGLMFGDRRQDMNCQPIALREVDGGEFDTAFHQARNERDVARQPIKLRNDQRCLADAARLQRYRRRPAAASADVPGSRCRRQPTNERTSRLTRQTKRRPSRPLAARGSSLRRSRALARPSDRRSCCATSLNQARSTPAPSDSYCAV
jgi:hypothetical protein